MVVALHSGSTTRFEMGDDAFTTNMSLLTTGFARSPGQSTTIHVHIRGTLSDLLISHFSISVYFILGLDSTRWIRSR